MVGDWLKNGCLRLSKMNKKKIGLLTTVLFFLITTSVFANPSAPTVTETKWETGSLNVCYEGVTPGYTIILYSTNYKTGDSYTARDTWTASSGTECHMSLYFENGQTVWYYIVQVEPDTGLISPQSNITRQTPPITAFIINWQDMLKDLQAEFQKINDSINNQLKPSDGAVQDLQDAVDGLKDAVGAGEAEKIGSDIKNGLDSGQGGMKPPAVTDDGNGTYTGGSGGFHLPNIGTKTDDLGLVSPKTCEGTDNDVSFSIPYGVDFQGNMLCVKLFTQEQLDKMKWLGLVRTLASATLWIMFGMWIVQRFTPIMKV
jgi:hypothetical protein